MVPKKQTPLKLEDLYKPNLISYTLMAHAKEREETEPNMYQMAFTFVLPLEFPLVLVFQIGFLLPVRLELVCPDLLAYFSHKLPGSRS